MHARVFLILLSDNHLQTLQIHSVFYRLSSPSVVKCTSQYGQQTFNSSSLIIIQCDNHGSATITAAQQDQEYKDFEHKNMHFIYMSE